MSTFREYRRERRRERWESRGRQGDNNGHVWTGIFLLIVGGLALTRSFDIPMPRWLFSWQMLLIGIGLFIGLRRGFRDGGWFVPIIIGGAFLVNDYFLFGDMRRHIWPVIIITIGLLFLIRPRGRRSFIRNQSFQNDSGNSGNTVNIPPDPLNIHNSEFEPTSDDYVSSTCIFSGAKKVILSKNFKGGDLVNVFGGCEVDLTQADMTSPAVLEVTAIFGGATLLVPSNWAIKSEAVTIFGGIDDKRKIMHMQESPSRTLVLKGTMIFGGMEIKSY